MAICNRDKGTAEQYQVVHMNVGALAVSATREIWVAPFPCTVSAAYAMAATISGAPSYSLQVNRFIVGTGATTITGLAADQAVAAFSTSGLATITLATSGSTLRSLVKGDCIEIVSNAADSAFADLLISLQIQKTQDILSIF
jgi:hypothetical protein